MPKTFSESDTISLDELQDIPMEDGVYAPNEGGGYIFKDKHNEGHWIYEHIGVKRWMYNGYILGDITVDGFESLTEAVAFATPFETIQNALAEMWKDEEAPSKAFHDLFEMGEALKPNAEQVKEADLKSLRDLEKRKESGEFDRVTKDRKFVTETTLDKVEEIQAQCPKGLKYSFELHQGKLKVYSEEVKQ